MAAVSLHPLASRDGTQSATVVSVQIPAQDDSSANLAHRHRFLTSDAAVHDRAQSSTPTLTASAGQDQESLSSSPTARSVSPPFFSEYPPRHATTAASNCQQSDYPQPQLHEQLQQQQQQRLLQQQQVTYGLVHHDLDQYPILDDDASPYDGYTDAASAEAWFPYGKPPAIRAMSAAQYNELHDQYINLDVPSSAVFPFLHGVDGDNQQQNLFFGAPPEGMPAPSYRGLTVVRADMPLPDQHGGRSRRRNTRASSSASLLSDLAAMSESRSRADSLATTASSSAHSYTSSRSSDGEREIDLSMPIKGACPITASASTSSIASSTTPSEQSRASSLFSGVLSDASTEASSIQGDAYKASAAAGYHARASRSRMHRNSPPVYDPQPDHSFLTSSIMPSEILSPPYVADTKTNRLQPVSQNSAPSEDCYVQGPSFCQPQQSQGISLRNFKIQCSKYATISDIVIYCPAGLHEGALTLARWFREAQEACYEDRCERGLACLRYNVFVVTGEFSSCLSWFSPRSLIFLVADPFEVFERDFHHLIAIDGSGYSRNRIDFVDRERDEMQRMSAASEIDDNVWVSVLSSSFMNQWILTRALGTDGMHCGCTRVARRH